MSAEFLLIIVIKQQYIPDSFASTSKGVGE
jgi:hypothetical protein